MGVDACDGVFFSLGMAVVHKVECVGLYPCGQWEKRQCVKSKVLCAKSQIRHQQAFDKPGTMRIHSARGRRGSVEKIPRRGVQAFPECQPNEQVVDVARPV
jgi:hypothetical protein